MKTHFKNHIRNKKRRKANRNYEFFDDAFVDEGGRGQSLSAFLFLLLHSGDAVDPFSSLLFGHREVRCFLCLQQESVFLLIRKGKHFPAGDCVFLV